MQRNAERRGDCKNFIEALGDLAAYGIARTFAKASRFVTVIELGRPAVSRANGYVEVMVEIKSVALIKRQRIGVVVGEKTLKRKREVVAQITTRTFKANTACAVTRLTEWASCPRASRVSRVPWLSCAVPRF